MSAREPVSAGSSRRLPSLDEVRSAPAAVVGLAVTAGVVAAAQGAEAPRCGDSRIDELRVHSGAMRDDAARGALAATLREAGIALGWIAHGDRGVAPVLPVPDGVRGGDVAVADPVPPQPPPPPHVSPRDLGVDGGVRRVDPTPPQHPPPPVRRVQPSGGARAHSPLPRNPVDL